MITEAREKRKHAKPEDQQHDTYVDILICYNPAGQQITAPPCWIRWRDHASPTENEFKYHKRENYNENEGKMCVCVCVCAPSDFTCRSSILDMAMAWY